MFTFVGASRSHLCDSTAFLVELGHGTDGQTAYRSVAKCPYRQAEMRIVDALVWVRAGVCGQVARAVHEQGDPVLVDVLTQRDTRQRRHDTRVADRRSAGRQLQRRQRHHCHQLTTMAAYDRPTRSPRAAAASRFTCHRIASLPSHRVCKQAYLVPVPSGLVA